MRQVWMGLGVALSMSMAMEAVQQPPTQQPVDAAAASAVVTVTGCVQPSTAVGTGSAVFSSGATSSAPPAHFVLMQPSGPAPSSARATETPSNVAGAAGAAANPVGTSGAIVPVSHYILHGRDGELSKYAGQRVEIIGTSSQADPSGTSAAERSADVGTQVIPHEPQRGPVSTAPGRDASAAATPATAHPSVQHLVVQSVRMLAATCTK